jgi:hypothetical protein
MRLLGEDTPDGGCHGLSATCPPALWANPHGLRTTRGTQTQPKSVSLYALSKNPAPVLIYKRPRNPELTTENAEGRGRGPAPFDRPVPYLSVFRVLPCFSWLRKVL